MFHFNQSFCNGQEPGSYPVTIAKGVSYKTYATCVRPQAPWKRATERSEALGESQRGYKNVKNIFIMF